ncbi:hypothetical protein BKA62DRAFT_770583 [Auriculariales sp. MPI-PUGE-AT-0066]|nr:hypothetical protein BKA62DRAFT_770583 [Auriculariales sp. MPI-PUGE-AT-0066]
MLSQSDFGDELDFLVLAGHSAESRDHASANVLKHQLITSPLLTFSSLARHVELFPSRGLLGTAGPNAERVYVNTNTPSSGVICGVQGSGKSHSVSCILESALLPDTRIGQLPKPLAALVCHFDEEDNNRPCEAAHLSTPSRSFTGQAAVPQITVLCSPSNITRRRQAYEALPNVQVKPLYLSEQDLTAPRMLAIMGCDSLETMPLYMHSALMIIRSIGSDAFTYQEFRQRLDAEDLNPMQRAMCKLRMDLLDAYLRPNSANLKSYFASGHMVLVDLTDPFLDGLTAAILFDIVLGAFMQWQTPTGKIVVLDEAHKYLTNNDSARLTRSLASIIRQQRHLATRVVIATQEPTVVPPTVLDLASFVMCHRFSSPAWCQHLARHVSAGRDEWFEEVMKLDTGEALVFSPASLTGVDERGNVTPLGRDNMRLRIRPRLTGDGGASIMAVGGARSLVLHAASDELTLMGSGGSWRTSPLAIVSAIHPAASVVPVAIGTPPLSARQLTLQLHTPTSSHTAPSLFSAQTTSPGMLSSTTSESVPFDGTAGVTLFEQAVEKGKAPLPFTALSIPSSRLEVPPQLKPLVQALILKHSNGVERVSWTQVGAIPAVAQSSPGGKGWLKKLIHNAEIAQLVVFGGGRPGTEWVSLLHNADRYDLGEPVRRDALDLPAAPRTESPKLEFSPTHSPPRTESDMATLPLAHLPARANSLPLLHSPSRTESPPMLHSLPRTDLLPLLRSPPRTQSPSPAMSPPHFPQRSKSPTAAPPLADSPRRTESPKQWLHSPPRIESPTPVVQPLPQTVGQPDISTNNITPQYAPLIRHLQDMALIGAKEVPFDAISFATIAKLKPAHARPGWFKQLVLDAQRTGLIKLSGPPEALLVSLPASSQSQIQTTVKAQSVSTATNTTTLPIVSSSPPVASSSSSSSPRISVPADFKPLIRALVLLRANGVDPVAHSKLGALPELNQTGSRAKGRFKALTRHAEVAKLVKCGKTAAGGDWVALLHSADSYELDDDPPTPAAPVVSTSISCIAQPPAITAASPTVVLPSTKQLQLQPSSKTEIAAAAAAEPPPHLRLFIDHLEQERKNGRHDVVIAHIDQAVLAKLRPADAKTGWLKELAEEAQRAGLIDMSGGSAASTQCASLSRSFDEVKQHQTATPATSMAAVKPQTSTTQIDKRFKPLLDVLVGYGVGQQKWGKVAGRLTHLKTSSSKSWFKDFVNDARGAGLIQTGGLGSPGQEWMKLTASAPFEFV